MHRRTPSRAGITLVETCLSTIIVGGLLGASVTAVGNLATARQITADRARGYQFAEALLTEAQMLPYNDPTLTNDQIGPSATELATGNRSLFNDCDDYANWSESTLQDKSGVVIANTTGWKRTVRVQWVNPGTGFNVSATSTGYKQINVGVSKNGKLIASMNCIKTAAWNDAVWLNGASNAANVTTSQTTQLGASGDRVADTDSDTTLVANVTRIVKGLLGL
ncbi:MAG: hypothetical protein KGS45_08405 [Planctomycetes bacterium]|nr:hypothetical protein [Planctomycetota bacterium]